MSRLKVLAFPCAVALVALGTASAPAFAGTNQVIQVNVLDDTGYAQFNQDPGSGWGPGDSIRACDSAGDGWGVTAYLDIDADGTWDRTATTSGHDAFYCSPWASGNITENETVILKVCSTKSGQAPVDCRQTRTSA